MFSTLWPQGLPGHAAQEKAVDQMKPLKLAGPHPRELTYETVVTRGCISLPSDLDCLIKHPGRTERSSSCYEALVKMSG